MKYLDSGDYDWHLEGPVTSTVVTGDNQPLGSGWYAVTRDVTLSEPLVINGPRTSLILCDGATLTATKGIRIADKAKLYIYAQSFEDKMGRIVATGEHDRAGIGGTDADMNCTIEINGGGITATGSKGAAGIGGGGEGDMEGFFYVGGGFVTATGKGGGAGIGAGYAGNARHARMELLGGRIVATGSEGAAGIGGGKEGKRGKGGEGSKHVGIGNEAVVEAHSGSGRCSAIGHGDEDSYYGNIEIADDFMVRAGNDNFDERDPAFTKTERENACKYRHHALIQPCRHPNLKVTRFDKLFHTTVCRYCYRGAIKEAHNFDPRAGKCRTCGFAKPKRSITVTFDANGGEGEMPAQVMESRQSTSLIMNEFTREGYTFIGWYLNKEGTGKVYRDGAKAKFTRNTRLYAKWGINTILVANSKTAEWTGKPITARGFKCYVDGEEVDLDFPTIIVKRTETDPGTYPVTFRLVTPNRTMDRTRKYVVVQIVDGELVIKKAKSDVTPPRARKLTYIGLDQKLVSEGKAGNGTMKYSLDKKAGLSASPTPGMPANIPSITRCSATTPPRIRPWIP